MSKLTDILKTFSISRGLIIAFVGFYVFAQGFAPWLFDWAALKTNFNEIDISYQNIITYFILPGSGASLFLTIFALWYFSHKIERMIKSLLFPVIFILMVAFIGVLYSLIFWSSSTAGLLGLEAVSIYTISLILFLRPKQEITLIPGIKSPAYIISSAILLIWITWNLFSYFTSGVNQILLNMAFNSGFGLLFALLSFLQIKAFNKHIERNVSKTLKDINLPSPEELSMAIMTNSRMKKLYSQQEDLSISLSADPDENEDRMNEILEKIAENGKDSLSVEEIRFLEDYSKTL